MENLPHKDFWKWLLIPFIIGILTLSHIEGLSKIMILYGLVFAGSFSLYFLYHRLSLQPEVIVYFIWFLWCLPGALIAGNKAAYFIELLTLIQIGIMLFLVAGITALRREISTVMAAIAISGIITLVSSLITGEFQLAAQIGSKARAEGFTGNANQYAYQLTVIIFSVFYFFRNNLTKKVWLSIILSVIFILSIIGVIFSGSRDGLISVLVFIFLWWLFCKAKRLPKNPIKLYIIVLILLSVIYYSTNYIMSNTFIGKRISTVEDSSTKTRFEMYQIAFDLIIKNPVAGVGLDNFREYTTGLYSHSDYLEVVTNTGIVGFILYFSIYIILWLRLSRIRKMTQDPNVLYIIGLLKAVTLTILLHSFADVKMTSKVTWLFLGSAIGYSWSVEHALSKMIFNYKEYLRKIEVYD